MGLHAITGIALPYTPSNKSNDMNAIKTSVLKYMWEGADYM
jgi:hypothetical protein